MSWIGTVAWTAGTVEPRADAVTSGAGFAERSAHAFICNGDIHSM